MPKSVTGACRPVSMTTRHSRPAREAEFNAFVERNLDPVHGRRRRRELREPLGQGLGGNPRDHSAEPRRFPVRRAQLDHGGHPGPEMRRDVVPDPHERLNRPGALDPLLAGLDQYAVHRNGLGHAAKEHPCHEDEQQDSGAGEEQTLPRSGNRQQTVELFAFFLCVGNRIVKRAEWIIEHDGAEPLHGVQARARNV